MRPNEKINEGNLNFDRSMTIAEWQQEVIDMARNDPRIDESGIEECVALVLERALESIEIELRDALEDIGEQIVEQIEAECEDCEGSGECQFCDGTGECPTYRGAEDDHEGCTDCEGMHMCSDCDGTKKCVTCDGEGV